MPARPAEQPVRQRMAPRAPYPYEVVASALREQIESGELAEGEFLPGIKALAAMHGVAVGTAHRAANLLVESGQVEVVAGRGTRVGRVHTSAD
jgi:DNA-binding GntR family transcriptional regulator